MNVTNLKGMRWAKHVERMGKSRDARRILVGSPKQRGHLEYLAINGKIMLKWMLKEQNIVVCDVAKCIAYSV